MKAFDYTITDPEGIHARPAGMLVKEAVKQGQTVTITVDGEDEEAAFSALETFFKENL
ncbi:MAG: HPr family phosphocarrier protein [Lachnospiraceae bacterium]|nr:HPr family phosphocarrier protein [Lachnospiraceae bacterium]